MKGTNTILQNESLDFHPLDRLYQTTLYNPKFCLAITRPELLPLHRPCVQHLNNAHHLASISQITVYDESETEFSISNRMSCYDHMNRYAGSLPIMKRPDCIQ
ncbi:unnamed protein product [Periconia digitata]|uniref:Uncharacterized protein n=1 Tax=Periconia digitata TaxID=1303443 RepID=A0A9W4URX4_9PLEO|nr:unnamed protein product [Periconia digitata]